MYIMFRSEDIGRYNAVPLVVKSSKKVYFGPRFVESYILPQISGMHFQIALTFEQVADFG